MKHIRLGLLGLGNIGSGVVKILMKNGENIAKHEGVTFQIAKILVRDKNKAREVAVAPELLTQEPSDVLENPDIDMVAEFMGGEEPAHEYLVRALENGKSVVTANKNVVATHWPDLEAAAKKGSAGLYYEASVGGGIPVIKTLWDSMQANNITEVMGIINGTTNYIMTRMLEEGLSYQDALAEAMELGYAEPDPTYDVEGLDAVYKLSILSSLAFHAHVPVECIYHEGITKITKEDIAYGKELGLTLKLLAIGKRWEDGRIAVRVHPTFIPNEHPLATVRGAYNAIYLKGDAVGDIMLYGRGAGDMPTGSAIVSDMVAAAKRDSHYYVPFKNTYEITDEFTLEEDWKSGFYINMVVHDRPGVLANVAGILGSFGVSISSVIQKDRSTPDVPIVWVTHRSKEQSVKSAVAAMAEHPDVVSITNVIRVEGRD
ncbi:MAG: homoserine dehydrogenase [Christensenellales bacterium]|jgi:homoserine dehydrogenase